MKKNYDIRQAAKQIQKWQKEAGLTGQDIAHRAGITPSYYSNIRKGQQCGSIETLTKIVHILGHDIGDLIQGQTQTFSKTKFRPILKPHFGQNTDEILDCIEIWLQSPQPLRRALKAFSQT